MSGILFKSNFYTKTEKNKFEHALNLLKHRGEDEEGILYTSLYSIGNKRLYIRDLTNGRQPMSILNHHLVYNGEIFNHEELIKSCDLDVKGYSDTLVLLKGLIKEDVKFIEKINGMFSFVYVNNGKIIAARDHIGSKPLYYTVLDGDILIASEIKALLAYGVEAVVGKEELEALLGSFPQLNPGKTLYKGIEEIPPGNYLTFDKENGVKLHSYFELESKNLNLSYHDVKDYVKYLVKDSIYLQSVSDVGISSFLSGGLDSSIIAKTLADKYGKIDTFSIDYEGNKQEFKPNAYEISRDEDAINILNKDGIFNHKTLEIDINTLFDYLKTTVILRDGPGMADIDSSLFFLAKEIAKKHKCATSGECADELFGGYPWFKKKELKGFPWVQNIDLRNELLSNEIKEKIDIKKYLEKSFETALTNVPVKQDDSRKRKYELTLNYLNIKYFMPALLRRKDAMTMGASLEARIPFADKRIVEFSYNLPLKYKIRRNVEKAVLRDAFKDILPKEIINRKKSPYPKSQSSLWKKRLEQELLVIISKETRLSTIFNLEKIKDLILSDKDLEVPWFGQLMRKDQLLAFIYQINYWFEEYKIRMEI